MPPQFDDSFAKGAGHPPSAAKTICVDLDSTIIPWGDLMEIRDAYPGVVEAMQKLHDAGYLIVILTSRMSPTWWHAEGMARGVDWMRFGAEQFEHVEALLRSAKVPYDRITSEKVPALAYFDDKGIRVDGVYTLAKAIGDFLHGLYDNDVRP